MESTWVPINVGLPNDGELKLLSINKGNNYYFEIGRYNTFDRYWMLRDDSKISDIVSVRAWADLLPLYTG